MMNNAGRRQNALTNHITFLFLHYALYSIWGSANSLESPSGWPLLAVQNFMTIYPIVFKYSI